jgi:hypothetical protein
MRPIPAFSLLLLTACAGGSATTQPAAVAPASDFPGLAAIRDADLRADLFAMAGEEMRGREAGTIDELRASGWLAERAREAGLEPAGEDGTWYQWFPLRRLRQSATSVIAVGGSELALWRDVVALGMTTASVAAPIVWLGASWDTAAVDVRGRVAAIRVAATDEAPPLESALAARRYGPRTVNQAAQPLLRRGAVAVIAVADPTFEPFFDLIATNTMRGRYWIEGDSEPRIGADPPVLLVRAAAERLVSGEGAHLSATLSLDRFDYPSVNVVGRVQGTDPAVRGQYVLFSGHQDHDGVRSAIAGDSSYSGADDNATVSVALLAIARAWAQHPGRRSALFVWHGAEEKGLNGSEWHVAHPLVPRDSIVAVLNGDMIGRNHPDTAALLGSIPPHRNSTDLVAMAHEANRRVSGFAIDSTWDRPEHREGWYFRSDHLPYARANIPALFFTSLLHEDYHTPFDNPERIDIAKLGRMTRWMYGTGWLAANAPQRPRIDAGFRLER